MMSCCCVSINQWC